MARKSGSTIVQEELYPPSAHAARQELDDARLVDLDVDEESPFLRGQKRVSARRSSLPKKTASRLLWAVAAAAGLCVLSAFAAGLYQYGERSWRFRVETPRMVFVVTFDPEVDTLPGEAADVSTMEVVVVTAWRIRP